MIEFDNDLDVAGTTRLVRPKTSVTTATVTAPVITETLTVTRKPSERTAYVGKDETAWTWEDLRDYVVHEIEERFGTFPRDSRKEYGIFNRFINTYGAQAPLIARYAFEIENGLWKNAPVSVNRFCKGSDVYFAIPIAKRIEETGWR